MHRKEFKELRRFSEKTNLKENMMSNLIGKTQYNRQNKQIQKLKFTIMC